MASLFKGPSPRAIGKGREGACRNRFQGSLEDAFATSKGWQLLLPQARAMKPDWARNLRNHDQGSSLPHFVIQSTNSRTLVER